MINICITYFKRSLQVRTDFGHVLQRLNTLFHMVLAESQNDEQLLDVHLDDRLAQQGGAKECPKWNLCKRID